MRLFRLALLAGFGLASGDMARADALAAVEEAAELLDEARAGLDRETSGRRRVRALARAIRAYETALIAAGSGLRDLRREEAAIAEDLGERNARIAEVLTALQLLERLPPELRALHPGGPVSAARAGTLLSALYPELEREAAMLRQELDALSTQAALQEAFADDIRAGREALADAKAALEADIADAKKETTDPNMAREVQRLARVSRDLSALADGLSLLPDESLAGVPEALDDQRGALVWPVAGTLHRAYGEADAAGISRPGVILKAPEAALVSAPAPATVRYTGPFLAHGQVVILAYGADQMMILSGLGRVFVRTGDAVEEGAPLGLMPGRSSATDEFLIEIGHRDDAFLYQPLYIEFREAGVATDPRGWFEPVSGEER